MAYWLELHDFHVRSWPIVRQNLDPIVSWITDRVDIGSLWGSRVSCLALTIVCILLALGCAPSALLVLALVLEHLAQI